MASPEIVSRAAELLRQAASRDASDPDQRLERGLLVAAALREVLSHEPVVDGGTAEDFWTADEYHQTDLDIVTWPLTRREQGVLRGLGFTREGRHWVHDATGPPVEFPESRLAGDEARIHRHPIGHGVASIIGVEDLYLDRLRQSTVDPEDAHLPTYLSALAIAASNHDRIDWRYVDSAIRGETRSIPDRCGRSIGGSGARSARGSSPGLLRASRRCIGITAKTRAAAWIASAVLALASLSVSCSPSRFGRLNGNRPRQAHTRASPGTGVRRGAARSSRTSPTSGSGCARSPVGDRRTYAVLPVRDSDDWIHRISYQITLLGKIVFSPITVT